MQKRKLLEYMGTLLAGIGFMCLSVGYMFIGFLLGVISCLFLISFFKVMKLNALLCLQVFFLFANILGMYNNF